MTWVDGWMDGCMDRSRIVTKMQRWGHGERERERDRDREREREREREKIRPIHGWIDGRLDG